MLLLILLLFRLVLRDEFLMFVIVRDQFKISRHAGCEVMLVKTMLLLLSIIALDFPLNLVALYLMIMMADYYRNFLIASGKTWACFSM